MTPGCSSLCCFPFKSLISAALGLWQGSARVWGGISGIPLWIWALLVCVGWGRRGRRASLTPKWSFLPFSGHTCHLQNTHSFFIQHQVFWVPTVYPIFSGLIFSRLSWAFFSGLSVLWLHWSTAEPCLAPVHSGPYFLSNPGPLPSIRVCVCVCVCVCSVASVVPNSLWLLRL